MEDADWSARYIYCFYWSTVTALTIGYGDITPVNVNYLSVWKVNNTERITTTLIVLVTSIVFGYTVSSIGSIFT